ncbi:hypothetical protein EV213_12267 [Aureibacillus halotolerans]|uniref:Uncharacterized protein n=1 Tax=Aureibacillus halotolerans TaxID=1508390 RepID=A0A4R6TV22_9BACI|nr:hypothetical protein EV213_12267 [Aureibacillus halotolerans]
MQDELGSISSFCYEHFPGGSPMIYTDELLDGFERPSLYFPLPSGTDAPDTLDSYLITYTLRIKVFHDTLPDAQNCAESIAQSIRSQRYMIPLKTSNGDKVGEYMRIRKADVRAGEMESATLILTWDTRYRYLREQYEKMGRLILNEGVKA